MLLPQSLANALEMEEKKTMTQSSHADSLSSEPEGKNHHLRDPQVGSFWYKKGKLAFGRYNL